MLTRQLVVILALATLLGCGTTGISRREVFQQNAKIAELNQQLAEAEKNDASQFTPDGFALAQKQFAEAIESAREGDNADATEAADKGLAAMSRLNENLAKFREVMKEVIETRARAMKEQAPSLYAEEFEKQEQKLRKAAQRIENGELEDALEMRPDLVRVYSDLELRALKAGMVEAAKAAIVEAEKHDVEEYAPRTFKLAKEEIKLVTSVLEADRTKTANANAHAKKTIWLAKRAQAITLIAKDFENRDLSAEEIVLWYQEQLDQATEPLGAALPFDEPNSKVVATLRGQEAALVKERNENKKRAEALATDLAAAIEATGKQKKEFITQILEILNANHKDFLRLKRKYADMLSSQVMAEAEVEGQEMELKQKYDEIRASFDAAEATVLLEDRNVRIIAPGLQFTGKNVEVETRNFPLLNKIVAAIQRFPEAKLVVSGHTDSKGNSKKNTALSTKRAANVARFLIELAGLADDRVTSEGLGPVKPVAVNDTEEGRLRNRRIEVLIINR